MFLNACVCRFERDADRIYVWQSYSAIQSSRQGFNILNASNIAQHTRDDEVDYAVVDQDAGRDSVQGALGTQCCLPAGIVGASHAKPDGCNICAEM